MTGLEVLPQAQRGVWHRIVGSIAEAIVEGEPVATFCGGRVLPVLVEGVGSGARAELPRCPRCEAMLAAWVARCERNDRREAVVC